MRLQGRQWALGLTGIALVVTSAWAATAIASLRPADAPVGPAPASPGPTSAGAGVVVAETRQLPPPRTDSDVSVEQAMAERGSVRAFLDRQVSWADLGQLLWAAQGDRDVGGRTVPSAGGLYPLEVFVVRGDGVWHYRPAPHAVGQVRAGDLREQLAVAALDQRAFHAAPAVLAIVGVDDRSTGKYRDRGHQYVVMESGHAMQNVLLQATALGLGAVPTGAFHDDDLAAILDLPAGWRPLYLVPVGHPDPEGD